MTFHALARKASLITAIQMALAVGISVYVAGKMAILFHFSSILISGLWAGISAIVVMQVQIDDVHHAARLRILGSFLGGICSLLLAMIAGYNYLTMILTMFITTIFLSLLNLKMTLRLANLTALIIIIVGMLNPSVPPWKNALARVLESTLGVSVTVIIVWIFQPIRKKFDLFQGY